MVPQRLSNLTFCTYFLGTQSTGLGTSRTALGRPHLEDDITDEASDGGKDFSPPEGICNLTLDWAPWIYHTSGTVLKPAPHNLSSTSGPSPWLLPCLVHFSLSYLMAHSLISLRS